jgi:hypothetical protein
MLTVTVVAFGLAQGVAAADLEGKCEALSKTATLITGDFQVAENAITFSCTRVRTSRRRTPAPAPSTTTAGRRF